ncbi:disease resistance protein RGA4-like [Setaria viridis]|uniref:disease resistance protein RGA4-like n=1 Tax=Setaria viridis TaxID=4556 RepID=UPI00149366FB|nr:disease resistance protein RGA4-like [Setaria viridis]
MAQHGCLARAVYDATPVADAFPCRAWVAVRSPEDRDAAGILENIHHQLIPEQQYSESSLTKYLKDKRYLIVIDDVDDIEEEQWDTITSAFEGNGEGSRIVVTTTFRPTANRRSDPNGCVYKMRTLGTKDSMTVALRGRYAAELVQGSETLLRKCDGLPLALVSVARQLSSEDEPTGKFCSELSSKLGSYLEREDGEPNFARLRDVLMDNYTNLSDLTVRTCLLYLGMFPNDRPLRKNVIIRRWLAEGYARSEDITLSEHSVANGNFKTFIDRNIIQPVKISKSAEVKSCKTHGIMHEFLLHRSMCEKFIMCSHAPRDKIVRHLFVHGDVCNNKSSTMTTNVDLSRVRSLTVCGSAGGAISDFGKYKLMRVLDLEECTDLKDNHLKKVCKLWNLRYLSFGHSVTRLPKEIAKLKLLETLALSKAAVTVLPVEVIGLPCLTVLIGKFKLSDQDCTSSSELEQLSRSKELEELCRTCKLETLAGFVADGRQKQGFLQLMIHMKNLRKVKIWCEPTGDIRNFDDLNNDLVKAIQQYTRAPLGADMFAPCQLTFRDCPEDPCMLCKICTIIDLLLALSGMPFLLYLTLITDEIESFVIKVGTFQCLRRLHLVVQHENPALPEIEEGALPELVSFQVPCKHLAGPSGIEIIHLQKLQEIELHPNVSQSARLQWEAGACNHPNKPNVLPFKSIEYLVGDEPTKNSVASPMESRHEVGQLADKAQGPSVQHMPISTCKNSGLISEMDHSTQQETMKYTIGPDRAALENSIGEQLLLKEPWERTTVHTKQGNSSFQSSPKDRLGSVSSHSGLGRQRDDLTTRDSKAPGKPISPEKPTYIQGRPDKKEASKYSVVRTDQQGNYTFSELGPACSCHASIELLNASNGKLQLHANGDVNEDLR